MQTVRIVKEENYFWCLCCARLLGTGEAIYICWGCLLVNYVDMNRFLKIRTVLYRWWPWIKEHITVAPCFSWIFLMFSRIFFSQKKSGKYEKGRLYDPISRQEGRIGAFEISDPARLGCRYARKRGLCRLGFSSPLLSLEYSCCRKSTASQCCWYLFLFASSFRT